MMMMEGGPPVEVQVTVNSRLSWLMPECSDILIKPDSERKREGKKEKERKRQGSYIRQN